MWKRLAVGAFLLVIGVGLVWSQTRAIRVRPGPVRFTVTAPLSTIHGLARIKDDQDLAEIQTVSEGEHEVKVLFIGPGEEEARPIETSRKLRASGPPTLDVQDVTIRVWPWSNPLDRFRARWADYQDSRGRRDVSVHVSWADGGIASGAYVSCDNAIREVGTTGIVDCGNLKGPVDIAAFNVSPEWDESSDLPEPPIAPFIAVTLPADESRLDVVLDAPADAGER
ncbi:MAG: hypothetical protein JNM17_28470 [Archangium sp.]|nr:hypothetical protein [Archangium sp.]